MNQSIVIERSATHGRVAVLRVQGRLDAQNANQLRARGAEVAAEGRNLILNLSGVTFMGSSGLGALLALSEEFEEQGGQVRIAEPSEAAATVMGLISLNTLVGIDADEATSLQQLRAA